VLVPIRFSRHWRGRLFFPLCWRQFAVVIERQAKRITERGERALGGVGFGALERHVVDLAGRRAAAFTRSMTFANDRCAADIHGDPYLGNVNGEENAAVLSIEDAPGFDRLAAPAVEAKDSIGFGDRVPPPDKGQFATADFSGSNITLIETLAQFLNLLGLNPITVPSR
jgi:hypothetical protein